MTDSSFDLYTWPSIPCSICRSLQTSSKYSHYFWARCTGISIGDTIMIIDKTISTEFTAISEVRIRVFPFKDTYGYEIKIVRFSISKMKMQLLRCLTSTMVHLIIFNN